MGVGPGGKPAIKGDEGSQKAKHSGHGEQPGKVHRAGICGRRLVSLDPRALEEKEWNRIFDLILEVMGPYWVCDGGSGRLPASWGGGGADEGLPWSMGRAEMTSLETDWITVLKRG